MNPIIYFFLALTAVLAATANAVEPVLDINGNIIFSGSYFVLPAFRGRGGGLALSSQEGKPCPLDVVQVSSEVEQGLPVKFSNWKPKVAFVPESTSLNIETEFSLTICSHPAYWSVNEFDQERKKWFVAAGAISEVFEEESLKSFFQIKKVENLDAYKFVFCPKNCIDVGIFIDENGDRRLALSSKPFLVQFKNADEAEDSSKIMST